MDGVKFRIWNEQQEIFHFWGFDIAEYLKGFTGIPHNKDIGIDYCRNNSEQYINKKDVNGKEIFEGDKLKIVNNPYVLEYENDDILTVEYDDFIPGFKPFVNLCSDFNGLNSEKHTEIIGNIHEVPNA